MIMMITTTTTPTMMVMVMMMRFSIAPIQVHYNSEAQGEN